jgi:hypothetical protein
MKRSLPLLVLAVALLAPAPALASGIVVKVQRASHLVAVTDARAHVSLVRTTATSRLHAGQRIAVTGRRLGNGVLQASAVRVVGRTQAVRFEARVLARSARTLVVSAAGMPITVHGAGTTTPPVGSTVEVQATVNDDELDDDDVQVVAPTTPGGTIEGHLTLGAGTITVTSEHLMLVLKVPAGLDLSLFRNGEEVLATFTQGADGSLTLTRLSTADDQEDTNDEDGGHDGGGDGGGHDGGGD